VSDTFSDQLVQVGQRVTGESLYQYGWSRPFQDEFKCLKEEMREYYEMAVKRTGLFSSRLTVAHALALLVVILAISNIYFGLAYRQEHIDRINALGLVLMQARGPLSESIHIMNKTIESRQIDVELWDVMLRDLIEHSRFYPLIGSLDGNHRSRWTLIQNGIDSVIQVTTNMIQKFYRMHVSVLNLTDEWLTPIISVRDILTLVEVNAFPSSVTIGPDPKVIVSDDGIMRAVDAVNRLEAQLEELQKIIPD